jgi:hypothetical protein
VKVLTLHHGKFLIVVIVTGTDKLKLAASSLRLATGGGIVGHKRRTHDCNLGGRAGVSHRTNIRRARIMR